MKPDMPEGVRIKRGRLHIHYQHEGKRHFEMLALKPSETGIREAVRIRKGTAARRGISTPTMRKLSRYNEKLMRSSRSNAP